MDKVWIESAKKLRGELVARDVNPSAADDIIVANAGVWFSSMSPNAQSGIIATMRSYDELRLTDAEVASILVNAK